MYGISLSLWILSMAVGVLQAKMSYMYGANVDAGVWGGEFDTTGDGSLDIQDTGYPSLGRRVGTMSYDTHSNHILMEVTEPHSIIYGPMCTENKDMPRLLLNLTNDKIVLKNSEWGECINCRISAFTLHHSKIYFMLTGEYMSADTMDITRSIQIRVLESCEKCPDIRGRSGMDDTYMSVIKCSKLVSNVYEKTFTMEYIDDRVYVGAKNLKILKKNKSLTFYFTIANVNKPEGGPADVYVELYKATR